MKEFCILIILFTLYVTVQSASVPSDIEKCEEFGPGVICRNCIDVIMCTDIGGSEWEIEEVDQCDSNQGLSCLNGVCTNNTNPDCNIGGKVPFPCTAVGIFPDPFDCQTFHTCCSKNDISDGHRCDDEYMYDPASTYCKIKMPSSCPESSLVPPCKVAGASGVISKNKSIYYICSSVIDNDGNKVLYPKMHLCPNGKIFKENACQ